MPGYIIPEEPQYTYTQRFGAFPGGYNPVGGHTGWDKNTPTGRPLRAACDGTITLAGNAGPWNTNDYWLEGGFAGLSVVLDGGAGMPAFTYNHLSRIVVTRGQTVKKGDIICYSGNSGSATTGPHHHFECLPPLWNFNNGTFGRVDPNLYCKSFYTGAVPVAGPNQRLNGPHETMQRATPSTAGAVVRRIPPQSLEVFEGFVRGQKLTVGTFSSDVWFKDKIGYAWAGAFESNVTAGLPDLTPRAALAANQRLVGSTMVRQRAKADTKSAVLREIAPNTVEIFKGFVRGEKVTIGTMTTNIWYVDDKGYAWAGGFASQSVVGLPDLTIVTPPKVPPVVTPPAPTPIPTPKPVGATMNGIDVAIYQEPAALNTVQSDFYIIKATEGAGGWDDDALVSNTAEARLTGKPVGFYHFARPLLTPQNTAAAEADSFLDVIAPLMKVGDVLILDWEAENQDRTDWALEWLDTVAKETGATPLIYLNAPAINGGDWTAVEAKYPLWFANYGTNQTTNGFVPPTTKPEVTWKSNVVMWQYTSKGRLTNYGGDLDLNIFYGSAYGWRNVLGAKRQIVADTDNPPIVEPDPPIEVDTEGDVAKVEEFAQWIIEKFRSKG